MISKIKLISSLFILSVILAYGDILVKPGEDYRFALPAGKMPVGERLIVSFSAQYLSSFKLSGNWYMGLYVNGKMVSAELPPEGSGALRDIKRKSDTFHGTGLTYTNKGLWNTVAYNSTEILENIYVSEDYQELFQYNLDITDLLADKDNELVIRNQAPVPGANEKNPTLLMLKLEQPAVSRQPAAELPDLLERSFVSHEVFDNMEVGKSDPPHEIALKDFPKKPGWVRVVRFRSRLNYGSGNNYCCAVKVNGKALSYENADHANRLLNRGMFLFGGREPIISSNGSLNVLFSNKWGVSRKHKDEEARKANWYCMDLEDLLAGHGDSLAFLNTANKGYFNEKRGFDARHPVLLVNSLETGYVPCAVAEKAPARIRPKREVVQESAWKNGEHYSVSVTTAGGIQLQVGKHHIFAESAFSYPRRGFNQLACKGASDLKAEQEWKGTVAEEKDGFSMVFSGKYYKVSRRLVCDPLAIRVRDTIENTSGEELGIANSIHLILDDNAGIIRKNGCQAYMNNLGSHNYPNANSSIFWGFKEHCIGLAIEDDLLRLQSSYTASAFEGKVFGDHLGFEPGKSYTLEWSIYCLPGNDYYDFVNAVRRDWKVNKTIPAMISWNGIHYGNDDERFRTTVRNLGTGVLIDGQKWFNANEYGGRPEFSVADEVCKHAVWMRKAKELCPDVKYLLQFQGAFSWRNFEGKVDPMADSAMFGQDGKELIFAKADPQGRFPKSTYSGGTPGLYHGFHYPAIGNNYYEYNMEVARELIKQGFDGIYVDTPNYVAMNYGRFTYNKWDGVTVDLDENYVIKRKYTDCCWVSGPARCNIYKVITDAGGVVVLNAPPYVRQLQEAPGAVLHFTEGDHEYALVRMHFTTPLVLGEHGGGKKDGTAARGRRKWWRSQEDFMDDMVWKLRNGTLYSSYWPPAGVPESHEWPTRDMFPLSIQDIHGGWIRGRERIITAVSGKYAWEGENIPQVRSRVYGKDGRMVSDQVIKPGDDGKFDVVVPENGMCILIR